MWYEVLFDEVRLLRLPNNHVLKLQFYNKDSYGVSYSVFINPKTLYGVYLIHDMDLTKRIIFDMNDYLSYNEFNEWVYYGHTIPKCKSPISGCPYLKDSYVL